MGGSTRRGAAAAGTQAEERYRHERSGQLAEAEHGLAPPEGRRDTSARRRHRGQAACASGRQEQARRSTPTAAAEADEEDDLGEI